MYNLLTTVLATVVMIATGIAGLAYLGNAYTGAATRAAAAQVVNGGVQIEGAQQLRRTENGGVGLTDEGTPGGAVAGLVAEGYLQAAPAPPPAAAGARWRVVTPPGGNHPVAVLALDGSGASVAALCAELARTRGFGCTRNLANLGAAQ